MDHTQFKVKLPLSSILTDSDTDMMSSPSKDIRIQNQHNLD